MSKRIPKSRVIEQSLRGRVTSGELVPGTALPSRRQLAKDYQTSRVTIDSVVAKLTAEGIFEPSDGNRPPVVADISQRTATVRNRVDNHATSGKALGANETTRILSIDTETPCPADVAPLLGVEPGDEVLCRSRVNLIDGRPNATGYSYYPPVVAERTPELARPESIPSGSRELAAERMGSEQSDAYNIITSRLATDQEREILEMGGAYNVVTQVARHVVLRNGQTVEVAVKVFDGRQPVSFHVEL